jgi:hypothetical protein
MQRRTLFTANGIIKVELDMYGLITGITLVLGKSDLTITF